MEARFNVAKNSAGGYKGLLDVKTYLKGSGVEMGLVHLVNLRASQINGCAFCIDMHWKDLRAIGESEERLYALDAWREYSLYSDRERAALEWTEALTLIREGHVSDEVYERVRQHLSEKEMSDLTMAISVINAWNRIAISSRMVPGLYQPPKHTAA